MKSCCIVTFHLSTSATTIFLLILASICHLSGGGAAAQEGISAPPPLKERRLALVIGNSAYSKISPLTNPRNDARAMEAALRRVGFDVEVLVDLRGSEMRHAIEVFTTSIRYADIALFFFAGHGFQYNARNYLLGVDAALASEAELVSSAVNGDNVISAIESAPGERINLMFFDACRDDPLKDSPTARLLGSGPGLAKMEQGVPDTLISFSAQPGKQALDGVGKNSPFVQALIKHIEDPDVEISVLLKTVGRNVSQITFNKQRPQQLTGMNRLFFFKPVKKRTSPPATFEGGVVVGEFAAWQIVCKPSPSGERGACAATQSVTISDENNVGMTIYYQPFNNGTKVLRVFAPLGILLPPGLGLKIDGMDIGRAPFTRCNDIACYAQISLDESIIKHLRDGSQATFTFYKEENEGFAIPVSLGEFGGALSALDSLLNK